MLNTKIRILDHKEKSVYVILKKGFNKKYLEREIFVKENFPFLNVPKICKSNHNSFWYSEEYITGISPDRMPFGGRDVLGESIKMIHKLIERTNIKEKRRTYLELIENRILINLEKIKHFDKNLKMNIMNKLRVLLKHLECSNSKHFSLSYCHGDFQQGNIIFDGIKTWILDWEYSGFKQPGYDMFVLLLKSRTPMMVVKNFLRFYNGDITKKEKLILEQWPKINLSRDYIHFHLILFLLEELDLHVEENSNVLFYEPSIGLTNYIDSMEEIIEQI